MDNGIENRRQIVTRKGSLPGAHFVQDRTQREDIGPGVDAAALGLLRGHVGDRSQGRSLVGQRWFQGNCRVVQAGSFHLRVNQFDQAEVENLGVVVPRQEDIVRFDIAVDKTLGVSRSQGTGYLDGQVQDQVVIKYTLTQPVLEAHALHQFHDDIRSVLVLTDVVDGANAGMIQGGGGAGFTPEALQGGPILGYPLQEELDGDLPPKAGVLCPIDFAHSTSPDPFEDLVMCQLLAYQGTTFLQVNQKT